jgi:hypothetical protein
MWMIHFAQHLQILDLGFNNRFEISFLPVCLQLFDSNARVILRTG